MRICPVCNKQIPIESNFHFDENLNLIHDDCGQIAYRASLKVGQVYNLVPQEQVYLGLPPAWQTGKFLAKP